MCAESWFQAAQQAVQGTDRQTNRWTERQTNRQRGRQTERQTERKADRQWDGETSQHTWQPKQQVEYSLPLSLSLSHLWVLHVWLDNGLSMSAVAMPIQIRNLNQHRLPRVMITSPWSPVRHTRHGKGEKNFKWYVSNSRTDASFNRLPPTTLHFPLWHSSAIPFPPLSLYFRLDPSSLAILK